MIARRLTSVLATAPLVVAFVFAMSVMAHTAGERQPTADETDRRIGFQQEERNDEAVASLRAAVKRNQNDLTAWNHLGLALEQKGDTKEARKAHEKAAKLGDKLLADQLNDVASGAEFSERLVPLGAKLVDAAASAQKYIQLAKPSGKSLQEWKLRIDSLLAFAEIANAPPGTPAVFTTKEVTVKARVLAKPEPQYTEEARQGQITGTVVVRAIFAANGRVIGIRVISGLPGGLNERAIHAARQIKFIPAMKDGRPVSMFIQLEYHFSLY
jgi:TonB family protein